MPLIEPPIGIGSFPLCRFMYLTALGASCAAPRVFTSLNSSAGVNADKEGRSGENSERMKDISTEIAEPTFRLRSLAIPRIQR